MRDEERLVIWYFVKIASSTLAVISSKALQNPIKVPFNSDIQLIEQTNK